MAIETGVDEFGNPWGVDTDVLLQGRSYVVRLLALPPYRNENDEMFCTIDFLNVTDNISGRYENVWAPAKLPQDNGQRRHSMLRLFLSLKDQPAIPSPIFG